jgi:hypothetical protein
MTSSNGAVNVGLRRKTQHTGLVGGRDYVGDPGRPSGLAYPHLISPIRQIRPIVVDRPHLARASCPTMVCIAQVGAQVRHVPPDYRGAGVIVPALSTGERLQRPTAGNPPRLRPAIEYDRRLAWRGVAWRGVQGCHGP